MIKVLGKHMPGLCDCGEVAGLAAAVAASAPLVTSYAPVPQHLLGAFPRLQLEGHANPWVESALKQEDAGCLAKVAVPREVKALVSTTLVAGAAAAIAAHRSSAPSVVSHLQELLRTNEHLSRSARLSAAQVPARERLSKLLAVLCILCDAGANPLKSAGW